jgi:hypothetical protein
MRRKLDIEAVREELTRLAVLHRGITPDLVVEAARDPAHPAHDHFEWDDTAAAREYRLSQARHLISTLRVHLEEEQMFVPVFVRDPDLPNTRQGYVQTSTLRNDRERALEVLVQEFTRVDAGMHRMLTLARAFGMESEIDTMVKAAAQARERLVGLQA